ncbi:hypothetical protein IV203_021819 [Nitzschia inconspicua]|uniref:Uncharacterized protein n=1 Tax=Nitzschia inconspicua TaxID=303405 RepID=A0A9K3PEI1_9STRA|nr:hypothetical protein IV203_021819 [Nitzschia inconspicua]
MLPTSGAVSSPPSSPTHSFLSSLLRTYGVKNMIIVQDNAKPGGGTIRQRNRLILFHAVTATSTKPPPLLLPTSSKCRWSSNSCSNSGGPLLQKQMYQCVQRGGIVKDERLPLDPAKQGHLGRPCPLRIPRFSPEDVPGAPASPKIPMRRASIEEDEVARIAALQVCFTGEEEGEEDEAGEIGEGEGVEDEGIYAKQTHRSVSLDPIPSAQSMRRGSNEPLHNTVIGKVDAAFATLRRCNSWNDRYGNLKEPRALDTIIATRHGSIPSSSQKVASQIDRILHDMGLTEHSTSSKDSFRQCGVNLGQKMKKKFIRERAINRLVKEVSSVAFSRADDAFGTNSCSFCTSRNDSTMHLTR